MSDKAAGYTDRELLNWLEQSSVTFRAYDFMRSDGVDESDGVWLRWNLYNYRTGKGYNAPTVREVIVKAMRADA